MPRGGDGRIYTVAGSPWVAGDAGDGGAAVLATMWEATSLALAEDGTLYVLDRVNARVRSITPDQIMQAAVAPPNPNSQLGNPGGFSGDMGPAAAAMLRDPYGIALGADGPLYIADTGNHRIHKAGAALPGFTGIGDITVSSRTGSEIYIFDARGRHRRTLDAMTGAMRYEFGYDAAGRLSTVTDGDGNVTTIERDADGNFTGITGPYGQATAVTLAPNGYLTSITNPNGETTSFTYTDKGPMRSVTDANGNTTGFQLDQDGRQKDLKDTHGKPREIIIRKGSPST